jgi:YHS domain-containing protein
MTNAARKMDSQLRVDPVCGTPASSRSDLMTEYAGREIYFCSEACRERFEASPERFVPQAPGGTPAMATHRESTEGEGDTNSMGRTGTGPAYQQEPHYIPKAAIHESHIQRAQNGSRWDVEPHDELPDPYGEEAIAKDVPTDEEAPGMPPDDSVLPG